MSNQWFAWVIRLLVVLVLVANPTGVDAAAPSSPCPTDRGDTEELIPNTEAVQQAITQLMRDRGWSQAKATDVAALDLSADTHATYDHNKLEARVLGDHWIERIVTTDQKYKRPCLLIGEVEVLLNILPTTRQAEQQMRAIMYTPAATEQLRQQAARLRVRADQLQQLAHGASSDQTLWADVEELIPNSEQAQERIKQLIQTRGWSMAKVAENAYGVLRANAHATYDHNTLETRVLGDHWIERIITSNQRYRRSRLSIAEIELLLSVLPQTPEAEQQARAIIYAPAIEQLTQEAERLTVRADQLEYLAKQRLPNRTVLCEQEQQPADALSTVYIVKRGERLRDIAERCYGEGQGKYWQLISAVNGKDPRSIQPGDTLIIPPLAQVQLAVVVPLPIAQVQLAVVVPLPTVEVETLSPPSEPVQGPGIGPLVASGASIARDSEATPADNALTGGSSMARNTAPANAVESVDSSREPSGAYFSEGSSGRQESAGWLVPLVPSSQLPYFGPN